LCQYILLWQVRMQAPAYWM